MIDRRALLGGLAATALAGRAGGGDAALRQALDGLAALPGPAARLATLAGFDPGALPPAARIDLLTVRAGIEIDARLAALLAGKDAVPYRVQLPDDPPGIWHLPNGDAAYRLLLERTIGGPLDPEATHRRFEREAARLAARADRLLRGLGFARGSVGERFRAIFRDRRWLYPDSDSGRDRAVADMNGWLDAARRRVPELIGPVPGECMDVSARRMGRADEAGGKGGYRELPAPGRSGAYYVDLHDIARRPRWSLKSVVHHELLPGHMIQLPIEAAARAHPLRPAYLPAFAEGWAIHAEQLMADRGAYAGDALGELGHVHWLLFRVGRGLADTGIHHRRWSVAEARRRLEDLQGEPAYFAAFDTDLRRICAEPAVRAVEAMTWLALADRARERTPAGLRAMHQTVLADGRKPMRLLR